MSEGEKLSRTEYRVEIPEEAQGDLILTWIVRDQNTGEYVIGKSVPIKNGMSEKEAEATMKFWQRRNPF